MNKILFSICVFLVNTLAVNAQISSTFHKSTSKYFEHTVGDFTSAAKPLFVTPFYEESSMITAEVNDGGRDWTNFTTKFISQVLKKHFTIEEIRKMLRNDNNRASAQMSLYFDYS